MSTVQIVVTIAVFLGAAWFLPAILGGYANTMERLSIFLYRHAIAVRTRQQERSKVLARMWASGRIAKAKKEAPISIISPLPESIRGKVRA